MTAHIPNSAATAANLGKPPAATPEDPLQELRDAIDLLADMTEAHTAALYVRDAAGETLRPVVWHTLSRSFRAGENIHLGEGVVGYVAKHGVPVDVDRYQQGSTATRLYAQDEGIKAFLALPVADLGVLVVDTRTRSIFGEREKKVIRDFTKFMANLLRHQSVCTREALYGRILDLLYEVENAAIGYNYARQFYAEVLEAGKRFTGLGMGFLCLLHPGRKQYTVEAVDGPSLSTLRGRSFPVSQGILGWIIKEMRPLTHCRLRPLRGKSYLITPDEPMRGYNAFLGAPLLAWRRLVGVWGFAGCTDRDIDREEERALQLAGHRVAATMEGNRLT